MLFSIAYTLSFSGNYFRFFLNFDPLTHATGGSVPSHMTLFMCKRTWAQFAFAKTKM